MLLRALQDSYRSQRFVSRGFSRWYVRIILGKGNYMYTRMTLVEAVVAQRYLYTIRIYPTRRYLWGGGIAYSITCRFVNYRFLPPGNYSYVTVWEYYKTFEKMIIKPRTRDTAPPQRDVHATLHNSFERFTTLSIVVVRACCCCKILIKNSTGGGTNHYVVHS